MSVNKDMVEYFIGEFYRTKSVNLDELVTPKFKFVLVGKIPLNFKQYVKMAEAIRNIVKLNITDISSEDDKIFILKYHLDVMILKGGFGKEITGIIIVSLIDGLVDKIEVTRSHNDQYLEDQTDFKDD